MAAINHSNVTLIEQRDRVEKILSVHKAHTNRYIDWAVDVLKWLHLHFQILTVGLKWRPNKSIKCFKADGHIVLSHYCLLNNCNMWHKNSFMTFAIKNIIYIYKKYSKLFSRIPTESLEILNTLHLLRPLCLQFSAEAINRWLYLELVPCLQRKKVKPQSLCRLTEGQHFSTSKSFILWQNILRRKTMNSVQQKSDIKVLSISTTPPLTLSLMISFSFKLLPCNSPIIPQQFPLWISIITHESINLLRN